MNRATKYEPIKQYLLKHNSTVVQLTYKEIEDIIDNLLPSSAYNHAEWWSNGGFVQAEAWLDAGWEVEEVVLGEYIVFGKKRLVQSTGIMEIEEEIEEEIEVEEIINNKDKSGFNMKYIYFGLAAVVLLMFFTGAKDIGKSGHEITYIKSVGGKTMEEAYYAELGNIYLGYATVIRAAGIFFSSILVWLGLKE